MDVLVPGQEEITPMKRLFTYAAIGLFGAGAALAQTAPTDESRGGEAIYLSLDDAIERTVEQNLTIKIQDYVYMEARQDAYSAEGPFDFFIDGNAEIDNSESPALTSIDSSVTENIRWNLGASQLLPSGGTYSLRFNNNRRSAPSPVAVFDPSFFSGVGVNFIHPLLRDFGVDVTTRGIRIARNNLGVSREEFRRVLSDTILAVDQAYYDLIAARENLEVARQSRDLALDQERITQIRIDVGASAPLDILQPRVAIATREETIIIAEASVRDAEDRLRRLMNLPPAEWAREIIPTEELEVTEVEVDSQAAVARAYELRPEVRQNELRIENGAIQERFARNQVLPQLDFQADYGFAGVGGTLITERGPDGEIISTIPGGYEDALEQVYGLDFPSWTVGLNFGVPLRNIGAKAEARRAELELERLRWSEDQLLQNIAVEVRQAARDIERFAKQIVAAQAAREAAEQNVDAERKRFDNGMTTNFNVLEVQQELADSRSREIAALVNYQKAVSFFHRAVGDLIEYRGIRLDEPELTSTPFSRWQRVNWLNYGYWADED